MRRLMMVLNELNPVPEEALPLAEFRAHLRLGTGFGEDTLQDALLSGFLRAAMAAVEGQIGKALIARDFEWTLSAWTGAQENPFPVSPVTSITEVALLDRDGSETLVASEAYGLVQSAYGSVLAAAGACLPTIPLLGTARIRFEAGLAPGWGDLPADLAQAVLLLSAHYYENRSDSGVGWMPYGVTSLLRRYKPLRLSARAGR